MRKEKVIVHAVIAYNGPVQIPRPAQRSHDYNPRYRTIRITSKLPRAIIQFIHS